MCIFLCLLCRYLYGMACPFGINHFLCIPFLIQFFIEPLQYLLLTLSAGYGVYDECYFLLVFVHARVVAMQVFQLAKVI